jgi:hypothetical protein
MPCVRFESTIPASERAKTVHASDRSATVTDYSRCKFENVGNFSGLHKYLKLQFILLQNFLLSLTILRELQA